MVRLLRHSKGNEEQRTAPTEHLAPVLDPTVLKCRWSFRSPQTACGKRPHFDYMVSKIVRQTSTKKFSCVGIMFN
jgi:hypothetical protein